MHFFDLWAREVVAGDWLTDKSLHPHLPWHREVAEDYLEEYPQEKAELALMKPTAYLINLARGPVVDQGALTAALRDRTIRGAALDVLEGTVIGNCYERHRHQEFVKVLTPPRS